MTVNEGLFSKILLLLPGALFMAMSVAKGLTVRGALSRSPGIPAHASHRVVFFLVAATSKPPAEGKQRVSRSARRRRRCHPEASYPPRAVHIA